MEIIQICPKWIAAVSVKVEAVNIMLMSPLQTDKFKKKMEVVLPAVIVLTSQKPGN